MQFQEAHVSLVPQAAPRAQQTPISCNVTLGLGRRRVERWSRFIVLPERNTMEPKACTPAHFEALLSRRFTEGATSVRLLFGEIKQQGYTGSYSHRARFIAP
jgi:hypothetical protein